MKLRRGISLVEVTISMVIVSIMSMGVIQMTGVSARTRALSTDRVRGLALANDLLAEIQTRHWADPDSGVGSFGVRVDEYDGTTRTAYNDIDDYDGWEQSPPLQINGDPVPGFEGWTRSVSVEYALVSGTDVVTSGSFETGKLITVTVLRNGRLVAEVSAFRALAWDQAEAGALPPTGEVIE
jgi:type II secretory pathway pseudopilin PulG